MRQTLLLLEICFFIHLVSALTNWGGPLLNPHGGPRQFQTAISTYYTLQDGFRLDPEMPILGKPWALPSGFPLDQWIVAAAARAFHASLQKTGRFVSLFFFYLSLFPLAALLRPWAPRKSDRFIILSLLLINPIFLFWSCAFTTDSLALCLSLCFLWLVQKTILNRPNSPAAWASAVLSGSLGGMVNPAAFLACCLPAVLMGAAKSRPSGSRMAGPWIRILFLTGIPLTASLAWIRHTAHVRSLNPLAAKLPDALFSLACQVGDPALRFSAAAWNGLFKSSHLLYLLGWVPFGSWNIPLTLLLGVAALLIPQDRAFRAILLFSFLVPLFLFMPTFLANEDLFYFIDVPLTLFLACTFLSVITHPIPDLGMAFRGLCLLSLLALSYLQYLSEYQPFQEPSNTPLQWIAQEIDRRTDPNDILVIYGAACDPALPYYAHRRALMDPLDLPLTDPTMRRALLNLGDGRIGAMMVVGARDKAFFKSRLDRFDLDPRSALSGNLFLFFKKSGSETR